MTLTRSAKMRVKPCRHCGSSFLPSWTGAHFCSLECRMGSKMRTLPNGCVEWTGSTVTGGYGCIRVSGKTIRAHRLSWELHNKQKIPNGLIVRHVCDNPSCVNPSHLELGTHKDNAEDCEQRGRRVRGEDDSKSKLSNADVIAICARIDAGDSCTAIAKDYNVHRVAINDIKLGKNWSWLTGR